MYVLGLLYAYNIIHQSLHSGYFCAFIGNKLQPRQILKAERDLSKTFDYLMRKECRLLAILYSIFFSRFFCVHDQNMCINGVNVKPQLVKCWPMIFFVSIYLWPVYCDLRACKRNVGEIVHKRVVHNRDIICV